MAVDVYDSAVHHIGLGDDASSLKGLVLVGPYMRAPAQPVFDRPSDIGTDDLTGQRQLSRWTQSDYSGGEFQEVWADKAMFAECVGMLPNQLGRSIRTICPMSAARLGDVSSTADDIISLDVVDGTIYAIYNNATPRGRVMGVNTSTYTSQETETVPTADIGVDKIITAAHWNLSTSRLWLGSNKPNILIYEFDWNQALGSQLVLHVELDAPGLDLAEPTVQVNGLMLFGQMAFAVTGHGGGSQDENRVWLHVSGNAASTGGTKWKDVGTLPGSYVTHVVYNNGIYILSRTGDSRTQLSMTQGDQIFPVLELPYFFRGRSMCEYAGRLYIFGVGLDLDGNDYHGELYEVNGTSLRLVRTFASETQRATPGSVTGQMETTSPGTAPAYRKRVMTDTRCLQVAEGLLWMPDSSYTGLEAYDATTDAFYGGPRLRTGDDPTIRFDAMVTLGDSIFVWGEADTTAKIGLYRTERRADEGEAYKAWLVTSDFAPEPGQLKVWSQFATMTRNVAPTLEYSLDSGDTWTAVTILDTTTQGDRYERSWSLSAVPQSRAIRFRITFSMTGAADELPGELLSHSLSFLVRGETKRRWQFQVNAALNVDGQLDGEFGGPAPVEQTPSEISALLWGYADGGTTATFRDVDGTDYTVIVSDVREQINQITPDCESFITVTLLEV